MSDLPTPYTVAPRKPLAPKQKLKMFLDADIVDVHHGR